MANFICKRGHLTTLPDRKEIVEHTADGLEVTATHDLGIDHDENGEYITCGWFADEDEKAPEVIESKHDLSKVRTSIKMESNFMNAMEADHVDEWSCSEKAYKN